MTGGIERICAAVFLIRVPFGFKLSSLGLVNRWRGMACFPLMETPLFGFLWFGRHFLYSTFHPDMDA